MVQDFGEMNATTPDNGGQIFDGSLEGVVVLRHDIIVVSHTILSRGNAIENEWSLAQIGDMNQWPQRQFVRDKVLEHRKANNLSPEQFANLLGIKPSHLHGLLYDKRTRISTQPRFGGVFCCPSKKSLARCRMRYYIVGASHGALPHDPRLQPLTPPRR